MTDPQFHTRAYADAILRAAGSSLANYTTPGTRAAILAAVQAVRDDECARVVDWLRKMSGDEGQTFQGCNLAYQIAADNFATAIERHEHRSASHDAD